MSIRRSCVCARAAAGAQLMLALLGAGAVSAQQPAPDPMTRGLQWRNVGNANLVGRISAIDALNGDWSHVVIGSASGGVFKSVNGGTTWTAIFDNYGAASIGDVKIFQANPDVIWVGTGEECGRNSAAWGDGVYKSTDGGRTFTNVGLRNTYNIGQITLHPTDPNIAYVAAIGNIWGTIGERGLFKTTDGGQSWQKLANGLPPADGVTGAIQVIMDPQDPNTLYASFWARYRRPWVLMSGGPNSGLFKSTDGGQSWRKLTRGLPTGDLGKIGIAVAPNNPRVVMAHVEHGYHPAQNDSVAYRDMTRLGSGIYRSEDGGENWTYLNRNYSRPFYYMHVAVSPHDDKLTYHPNINFQISRDGGRTLQSQQVTGGHCYHAIWLDPHNRNRYWIGSDGGLNLTHDHGASFQRFEQLNVTQYYIVGYDMRDPYWVYGGLQDAGSSGGPSMTRANAIYTSDWVNISGGDGYHAQADPLDWRWVYTESQPGNAGGNVGRMNMETRQRVTIRPTKNQNIVNYADYITPAIEQRQFANNWGRDTVIQGGGRGGGGGGGGPRFGAFRWNWSTPFIISAHNPRTLYLGANHLFKTVDQGNTWRIISPDLSRNEPHKTIRKSGGLTPDEDPGGGAEYHATIFTIGESPLEPGVIWVGTDDGNVQLTRNDGASWTEVGARIPGLPQKDLWVSRVIASHHDRGTAYVVIDGHRSANYKPYVFKTSNYGQAWTNITNNLPDGHPIYVIAEDPKNRNLLFVGSEFAVFYSLNGGQSWQRLKNNLPTVAIHDLKIHPRDNDLIVATHGRGLWIMDDISPLQQMTPALASAEAHLFELPLATQWLNIQPHGTGGTFGFRGQNPPRAAAIDFYTGPAVREVQLEIAHAVRNQKCTRTLATTTGITRVYWPMQFPQNGTCSFLSDEPEGGRGRGGGGGGGGRGGRGGGGGGQQAQPGDYRVTLTANGRSYTTGLTIRQDPMLAGAVLGN
jgi:photosystem II stability/assembly factor-like uncharacterized protein